MSKRVASVLSCHYHPKREAETKCEDCGKFICIDCKMIHNQVYHSGSGEHRTSYSQRKELCKPCYYNMKIDKLSVEKNLPRIIFSDLFLLIGFIILPSVVINSDPFKSSFFDSVRAFFGIFILFAIFAMCMVTLPLLSMPGEQEKIKKLKNEFLSKIDAYSMQTDSGFEKESITAQEREIFYCQQCGKRIDPDAIFCSHCGNSTAYEKALR